MARKVSIDWAAEDTADALHRQYRAEQVTEVRTRLHALWLLRQGQGPAARRSGSALLPDPGPGAAGGGGGGHGGVWDGAGGAGLD